MGKYYLVASHYNAYTKSYENEIVVKLSQVDLSTIQAIDNFTSNHTREELINIIKRENNIKDLNQLSIKYYKNNDCSPVYYRTIENNKDFLTCTINTVTKSYNNSGRFKKSIAINDNNKYLLTETKKIIELIKRKDLKYIEEIFGKKHEIYFLINRYLNTSYDDSQTQQYDYELILKEFSKYTTFRQWIVGQEKKKNKEKVIFQPKKVTQNINIQRKNRNSKILTIEENEQLYEKMINEELNESNGSYKVTYQDMETHEHNTRYIDEDKEEFISNEEMDQMYDYENQENFNRRTLH